MALIIYIASSKNGTVANKCHKAVLYGKCNPRDIYCNNPSLTCNVSDGYWKHRPGQSCATSNDCADGNVCMNWVCQKPSNDLEVHSPIADHVRRRSKKHVSFS